MCCKDKKVPLSQAQVLIRQVASALSHLESQHVAHRDVKSENVLVTEQHVGGHVVVKLCDFGYAVTYTQDDDMHTTMCGTPEFIPPEMITDSDYSARFVDPWALGALSYELVMGTVSLLRCSSNQETNCRGTRLRGTISRHYGRNS